MDKRSSEEEHKKKLANKKLSLNIVNALEQKNFSLTHFFVKVVL
jgi:hypothetical protein